MPSPSSNSPEANWLNKTCKWPFQYRPSVPRLSNFGLSAYQKANKKHVSFPVLFIYRILITSKDLFYPIEGIGNIVKVMHVAFLLF